MPLRVSILILILSALVILSVIFGRATSNSARDKLTAYSLIKFILHNLNCWYILQNCYQSKLVYAQNGIIWMHLIKKKTIYTYIHSSMNINW